MFCGKLKRIGATKQKACQNKRKHNKRNTTKKGKEEMQFLNRNKQNETPRKIF